MLAHWKTIKPVWAVTLEDGTRLITSGDHRFLTERGWKHVIELARHRAGPAAPDDEQRAARAQATSRTRRSTDAEYRRGYLCGLIRGDGHLERYAYERQSAADDPPLPARARRLRGASPRAAVPRGSRHRRPRALLRRGSRRASRDAGDRARSSRGRSRRFRSSSAGRDSPNSRGARASSPASSMPRARAAARRLCASPTPIGRSSTGRMRVARAARLRRRRRAPARERRAVVRIRGGLEGAAALLPPDRPGDHAQADDRRRRAEVRRARLGSSRSSRSGWSCRSTTSRPAPATSSPTAS